MGPAPKTPASVLEPRFSKLVSDYDKVEMRRTKDLVEGAEKNRRKVTRPLTSLSRWHSG